MGLHRHTQCFGNIWLLFGILFSICVFVGIPKIDKYLAFYLCYKLKKNEYTNKKVVILYAYPCMVQTNHFFGNTNAQKTVAKEKKQNLHTEEKPSLVYLCIGVSLYQGDEYHTQYRVFARFVFLKSSTSS